VIEAPQRAAAALGKGGCYVLCIFRWAEKVAGIAVDALAEFARAVGRECVYADGYVRQADVLLSSLAGGTWRVLKGGDGLDSYGKPYDLPLSYQPAPGELEIDRYEIAGEAGHFVLPDGWDPYGESRAVRDGRLVSKRIFRRINAVGVS